MATLRDAMQWVLSDGATDFPAIPFYNGIRSQVTNHSQWLQQMREADAENLSQGGEVKGKRVEEPKGGKAKRKRAIEVTITHVLFFPVS